MAIFAFLMAAIGPLVKQALVAIGVGVVSYAAVSSLISAAQAHVVTNWSAMSGATVQLVALMGFADALAITLGAITARGALMAVQHFGKV
jgi:hypothetical protein